MRSSENTTELIDLLRAGTVVSSFAGAFGSELRETRLTAMLGFLIALEPERFCALFAFGGTPVSLNVETRHEADRSDILIETTFGSGVIEAKVGATDPLLQSQKYHAKKWRVLLTEHIPSGKQKRLRGVKYLRWKDLVEALKSLRRSRDSRVRFFSQDLLKYLEEHSMVKKKTSEIYAREINDEESLALFLKAQLYGCRYEKRSLLAEALYFASHFGMRIARSHPGVHAGISYIASIEGAEVVETWSDLLEAIKMVRGKTWLNSHIQFLKPLHRDWEWPMKRSFLFLKRPRLVFNPPVPKAALQEGSGWLSKRSFSFDTLFEAWGC